MAVNRYICGKNAAICHFKFPIPRTSTRNITRRCFFALISFLLRNVWLYLQKEHFKKVKQGPQIIVGDKLRFDIFVLLIKENFGKIEGSVGGGVFEIS
ncbi:hypothetical protein [Methanococcoides burtonii]|uniref:Uncharacterized protein n=1 Tax=Methanococcoides burtonii (strain DSM 6242 / NBRC 107633 / OCM 468 / ACE-M) TaxID=259564 RepID=Q12X99_METBU|nr:hypothetical protein [Methanococcoides burtonii]ABE51927.1 Hypothetical protein Mbur_0987 [Methanococcoides burtonii DSM 6242]